MKHMKALSVLLAALLCLGPPMAYAEEFLPEWETWEEMPITEDDAFFDGLFYEEDAFFDLIPDFEPVAEDEAFFDEQFFAEDASLEAAPEAEPETVEEVDPQSALPGEDAAIPEPESEPESETESEPESETGSEPSFTLQTPEDLSIGFGVESQPIGFVSVSDVTDVPAGVRITLYIDDPAFVNVDDPDETIPLAITDADGNDVICLYEESMGAQTVELYIHVSAEDWARAALGAYAATISYRAVVE